MASESGDQCCLWEANLHPTAGRGNNANQRTSTVKALKQMTARLLDRKAQKGELEQEQTIAQREVSEGTARGSFKKDIGTLGAAHMVASLIPLRLAVVEAEIGREEEALTEELGRAVNLWNEYVSVQIQARFDEFIGLMLPWFGGKDQEKVTRQIFDSIHIPGVHDLRSAFFELGDYRKLRAEQRLQLARQIIAHQERYRQALRVELQRCVATCPQAGSGAGTKEGEGAGAGDGGVACPV